MRKKQQMTSRRPAGVPMFTYYSHCCGVPATKPPCVKVSAKDAENNSLGSWRCGKCNKPCICQRAKNGLDKETE